MDITAYQTNAAPFVVQALLGQATHAPSCASRPQRDDPFAATGPAAYALPVTMTSDAIGKFLELELAAETGDETAFARAVAALDSMQMTAYEMIRIAQLALTAGAPLCARQVASLGASRYPYNAELARMARVLAPPRVAPRSPAQDVALAANRRWVAIHRAEYQGQWVAVQRGAFLAAADSPAGLRERLSLTSLPLPADLLITRIG